MKHSLLLAPIATASFFVCGGLDRLSLTVGEQKRYSGKREKALKKERKLEDGRWKFIVENKID
ncbi:hypothetical protein [Chryseobacterium cheonjiense]|uniref:Uncharacterized protein n=1 Tax=Chryseobacterium cheonjiense TaxID=2728845 RepID=A0A7Y0A3K1_9FLAO|nr:hypothetical protein [Chryseobacterium cheonjiense]NML55926.1 hypothetical protein [Chryseobacterium cheonjiense]